MTTRVVDVIVIVQVTAVLLLLLLIVLIMTVVPALAPVSMRARRDGRCAGTGTRIRIPFLRTSPGSNALLLVEQLTLLHSSVTLHSDFGCSCC